MYLANQRQGGANTKTRGEVQRSGRKLYKQKGTGRARVGDAGSPIRRSGGVAMGPRKERNRSKDMPAKMRHRALCGALVLKVKSESVLGLTDFASKTIKTKEAATALTNIGLGEKKTLIVFGSTNDVALKSFRNIADLKYTNASQLNAYDVMSSKTLLFIGDAIDQLEGRLAK